MMGESLCSRFHLQVAADEYTGLFGEYIQGGIGIQFSQVDRVMFDYLPGSRCGYHGLVFGVLVDSDSFFSEPIVQPTIDSGKSQSDTVLFPQLFSDLLAAPAGFDPQVHNLLDDVLGCPGPGAAMFALALATDELPDADALDVLKPSIDSGPVPPYLGGDSIHWDCLLVQPPGMLID
jgi:hypothetical protein